MYFIVLFFRFSRLYNTILLTLCLDHMSSTKFQSTILQFKGGVNGVMTHTTLLYLKFLERLLYSLSLLLNTL